MLQLKSKNKRMGKYNCKKKKHVYELHWELNVVDSWFQVNLPTMGINQKERPKSE